MYSCSVLFSWFRTGRWVYNRYIGVGVGLFSWQIFKGEHLKDEIFPKPMILLCICFFKDCPICHPQVPSSSHKIRRARACPGSELGVGRHTNKKIIFSWLSVLWFLFYYKIPTCPCPSLTALPAPCLLGAHSNHLENKEVIKKEKLRICWHPHIAERVTMKNTATCDSRDSKLV